MGIEIGGDFDLSKLIDKVNAVRTEALTAGADVVKDDAVAKVPRESGDLADSAEVVEAGGGVGVRFSGPYARYQHEHLEFHHPQGGQAKYLEAALVEKKTEALERVAARIQESL